MYRSQPFLVQLRIENKKWFVPSVSLRIESTARPGESGGYVLKIPAQRAALVSIEEVYERRGFYALPPVDIVSTFPFGLLERRQRFKDAHEVLVYPRVTSIRTAVVEQEQGTANMTRQASSDGDEFFSLREYLPGDDMRRIAWRVSARLGTWMIRELARESSKSLVFLLDSRVIEEMPDFEERLEEAIELVASLGVTLLNRQFSVGLITPTGMLESQQGTAQERRFLEMLARLQAVPAKGHEVFDQAAMAEKTRSTLILISPNPTQWGRRNTESNLRVLDPREVIYA